MVLVGAATTANAQLLYSFESDDQGFIMGTFDNSGYISHNQFTGNATEGTGSLQVEIAGTGFGRHVEVAESNNGVDPITVNYDLFNTVAADPSLYNFDFDVTLDANSWSGLSDAGTFFHVNLFSNSSNAGFTDQFAIIDIPANSVGTFSASIPASTLSLGVDSEFFQLLYGNNGDATPGVGGEGLVWYLDNVRFTEVPQFDEQLLFSFETPDDAGTPTVNEQFEGWEDGFSSAVHTRTIAAGPEGVTEGSSALAVTAPNAFSWGSQFELDSDADPSLQSEVDMFISDFNSADRLAIDLTFPDDQFPSEPTFLTVGASLSDGDTFYQEFQQAGNPSSAAGNTITLFFDMDQFEDSTTNENLAVDGLDSGTFFRLALATNTNDDIDFFIDNIRLLSEPVVGIDGDYNEDGTVDAADYTVWRDNEGAVAGTLPNDSAGGVIGIDQYNLWAANYGSSSSTSNASAIPEPSTVTLGALTCLSLMGWRRCKE